VIPNALIAARQIAQLIVIIRVEPDAEAHVREIVEEITHKKYIHYKK
jgi:hypothetical protein